MQRQVLAEAASDTLVFAVQCVLQIKEDSLLSICRVTPAARELLARPCKKQVPAVSSWCHQPVQALILPCRFHYRIQRRWEDVQVRITRDIS